MEEQKRMDDEKVAPGRRSELMDAANTLANARRTRRTIPDLQAELRPLSLAEAYVIQDELAVAYEEVGGWKIGAPSADATPMFAPMPKLWMAPTGAEFRGLCYRGVEAEIAFLLGEDLPARGAAYSRDEVLAAVQSCHPAIEVLESAFDDPTKVDRFSMLADLQMHGGFAYGLPFADWHSVDFSTEKVTLSIDGIVRVERTGSNTAGDLLRLLPYLANEGARRTGGLRAGQWITTGSWTGNTLADKRSVVNALFSTVGAVDARFAPEQDLEKGLPGSTRSFL